MKFVLPWQLVLIDGRSMTPTLLPGDRLLVRHGADVVVGSIVLARFRSRPDLLVVKRVERSDGTGWWLASDNRVAGSDSRELGVADVLARAVLRLPGPLGPGVIAPDGATASGRSGLGRLGLRGATGSVRRLLVTAREAAGHRWPSRLDVHAPWDL